jgi:hypothetical protein
MNANLDFFIKSLDNKVIKNYSFKFGIEILKTNLLRFELRISNDLTSLPYLPLVRLSDAMTTK